MGVLEPAPLVSATVTVHDTDCPITTEAGHVTVVEVDRLLTVSEAVAEPVPALLVALTVTVKVGDDAEA